MGAARILTGTRILVVEDGRSISRLLQLELAYRGMQIDVAPDATAG